MCLFKQRGAAQVHPSIAFFGNWAGKITPKQPGQLEKIKEKNPHLFHPPCDCACAAAPALSGRHA